MKWVYKNWAKAGGVISIIIILYVLFSEHKLSDFNSLIWIHFALLLIHQFEEYVFPGGFKEFYLENVYRKTWITNYPLNNIGVILINVILGWTAYLTAAIAGEKLVWLTLGLLGVTLLNGILHSVIFVIKGKYNPGFFSALFLFIPFGIYMLSTLQKETVLEKTGSGGFVFIFGTLLIPAFIYLTSKIKI